MKKHPDVQLDLNFDSPIAVVDVPVERDQSFSLKLVHSQPKFSNEKNTQSDREKILFEVVSYARKLSW
jgi:hypothetical protein